MDSNQSSTQSAKYPPKLTALEQKVVALIQADFPITRRPFLDLAKQIDVDEEVVLKTLQKLQKEGTIRRLGATIRHQKSGYRANAMVAWQVEEDRTDEVGQKMASFDGVSHCYRREPHKDWPYNLYTMIHGKTEKSCYRMAEEMSTATLVKNYTLLFSRDELKKTSMEYFPL
ncbi:MAG: Lrp/AsnC family transcriptional regulator [Desulfobacterales bacterium]|nr:Lrp/AsnC family transcriptional regulator [Desulfobacterales bacterium]